MKLVKGQKAPHFKVKDIWGNIIDMSNIKSEKVLLSFLRFAECPVCQLRVSEIMREKKKLKEQDIAVIAIFQSPPESLKESIVDRTYFDFPVISDPDRVLYNLYQVKPSWLKTLSLNITLIKRLFKSIRMGFKPGKVEGLFNQIPADFLIDKNGIILSSKYGKNIADHIPLKEILAEKEIKFSNQEVPNQ